MVYLYCLTEPVVCELAIPELAGTHLIDGGTFAMVTEHAPHFDAAEAKNIWRHHQINSGLLRSGLTVIPFAYGTLIPLPMANSVVLMLKSRNIEKLLKKMHKKVEIGLKVLLPSGQEESGPVKQPLRTPGHSYLACASEKYFLPATLDQNQYKNILITIMEICNGLFSDYRYSFSAGKNRLLKISFLIDKSDLELFLKAFTQLKKSMPNCRLLLSGPWPPGSFINLTVNLNNEMGC